MQIFPEGKSKSLSLAAVMSFFVCSAAAVLAGRDLWYWAKFTASAGYRIMMERVLEPVNMTALASFIVAHPVLFAAVIFMFWIAAAAASAGVWLRRRWGYRSAVYILYAVFAISLLLLIVPSVVVPKPLPAAAVFADFNSFVKMASSALRIMCALLVVFSAWSVSMLSRKFRWEFYGEKQEMPAAGEKPEEK